MTTGTPMAPLRQPVTRVPSPLVNVNRPTVQDARTAGRAPPHATVSSLRRAPYSAPVDQQRSSRDLDVVVFGATGFVGKLTADYLARSAPEGVRIGLAGRNRDKLAAVAAGLPGSPDWPLLIADSTKADDVRALAERTRVVATTVGPYADYGMPLVAACAEAGTHYADLTGEVLFIRRSIDEQHAVAERTGARIVHSCGFDPIPSDLGVLAV